MLSCAVMKDDIFGQVRIVPISQIGAFEWGENASAAEQQVVRHPFLAIEIEDDSFLLLEETAAYESLKLAGVAHLPIQVCPSAQVRLAVGKLSLIGFSCDDLSRLVAQHPEQMAVDSVGSRTPEGCVSAGLDFPDREPAVLHLRHSTRLGCPVPMEYLFRCILSKGGFLPEMELAGNSETPLKMIVPSARLSLPEFSLDDLISASVSERFFPPGVIRASVSKRVLNIDFPLTVLQSDRSTAEIESFLRDLIFYREQTCRTSFFEGQVYILNR